MMIQEDSREGFRLLNAAFSGIALVQAAAAYKKQSNEGIPFILSYLILPLILHSETRGRLPYSIVTKLVTWSERNSEIVAGIPKRVAELAPATRKGVFLVTTTGIAHLENAGRIAPGSLWPSTKALKIPKTPETEDCFKKAEFVGKWLAVSGTVPTVLTALGVRL